MNLERALSALNNPVRRNILGWLKDRSNFPPALPGHEDLDGVCVGHIRDKAGLSQSAVSHYMDILKQAGLVTSERHERWTFYRRDEDGIRAFLEAAREEFSL